MPKQIIIAEQHHIAAVFWEDHIQELVVATGNQQVSDIYLGSVENVIPGIDAAFVNIGDAERNGFIHVTDLGPLRLKKTASAITELLTPQQKVLVQVMKEPTGNKGPRLTGNITLPGRYLVLMPYGKGVKLSRRIRDENERSRLRALAILVKPAGMGLLVRTEAEGKAEEAIMEDLEFLQKQWESIQYQASYTKPPALLNRDDDFIQRVLRDMYSAEVNSIVVDSQAGVKRVKQQLMNWSAGRSPQGLFIDYHRENQSILEYYRVNAAIREALKPRVELPSGGYIIMEPTEALTVVDVNSGSFTRSATARETVLWTNSEAATEIARQLRLRNIGGVIIVDFIDMDSRRDQLKLLEHFNKALKADKARPQIAQLSELGLVELTRKRQGKNIYELFGQICPSCGGLGHLAHLPGKPEGESLESPPITPPPIVLNISDKYSQGNELTDLLDYSYTNSPQSLELIHHPSYQEQGGVSGNNRRRRRRRLNEVLMKEELSNGDSPITRTVEIETNNYEERKSRPSSSNRSSRREEATLEKVSVEMSKLEQEMYALMGVSPLIRLEQEFKDPKSVLIKIKTPGEENVVESTEPKSTVSLNPIKVEGEQIEDTGSQVEAGNVPSENTNSDESLADNDDTNNSRRRRRRRSSAQKEVEAQV
ncbi:MAG: Rne/Rng family ribonuclease [Xenococcaceae cyanobacterium MO_188.B32]|nr:Rne/Rng family ribonuclease [Xenococcaceae cyanobacterium MO_188.B32]